MEYNSGLTEGNISSHNFEGGVCDNLLCGSNILNGDQYDSLLVSRHDGLLFENSA